MVLEKFVFRSRIESVKTGFGALKNNSAIEALYGLGSRFGQHNRQLIRNLLGGVRGGFGVIRK